MAGVHFIYARMYIRVTRFFVDIIDRLWPADRKNNFYYLSESFLCSPISKFGDPCSKKKIKKKSMYIFLWRVNRLNSIILKIDGKRIKSCTIRCKLVYPLSLFCLLCCSVSFQNFRKNISPACLIFLDLSFDIPHDYV